MTYDIPQRVLFKHCDPAGIVFYPRYFEMINDAVEGFFRDVLGYPFEKMHRTHGAPTTWIETEFVAVSRHGEELTISVEPKRIGRSSLHLHIFAHVDGEIRFKCDARQVHIELCKTKSEPWPDFIAVQLQKAGFEVSQVTEND